MPACAPPAPCAAPRRPPPGVAVQRCVLSGADPAGALLPLLGASARCAGRARQGSPLQASACQPLGAWHCISGFAALSPQLRGGDACVRHFDRLLEQQGYLLDPPPDTPPPLQMTAPQGSSIVGIDTCLERSPAALPATASLQAAAPSFVGNQSQGWDAMFAALLQQQPVSQGSRQSGLNLVLGFELCTANYAIMERLLRPFGLPLRLLSDPRARLEPARHAAHGATPIAQLAAAAAASDTLLVRPWQLPRSREWLRRHWHHPVAALPIPMGLAWSDAWLQHLTRLSGREAPAALQQERFALCQAINDARPLLCRQRFAVVGEPDFVMGISRYLIELGAGPALVLCQNGNRHWRQAMLGLLDDCGYRGEVSVAVGEQSAALQRLLRQRPVDLLLAPPALDSAPLTLDSALPAGVRRVALEHPAQPDQPPATLGYAGARHILGAILRSVRGERLPRARG